MTYLDAVITVNLLGVEMRCHIFILALALPLSACDTMRGAHYLAATPTMPEQNCVSNVLNSISGISGVDVSVQRMQDRTQIAPRYKKTKYHAEVVDFSYENQRFTVESSGNHDEVLVRVAVSQIGSCPSPEKMKSFFKIQKDVTQAFSATCLKEAKFERSTLSRKECPAE